MRFHHYHRSKRNTPLEKIGDDVKGIPPIPKTTSDRIK